FGCPVFDRYGCREVGNIAHECSAHRGLHVHSDINVVELLVGDRPAAPETAGDVVLTNLTNFVMPIIRYDLGDQAVASASVCTCGRHGPLLERIVGRQVDVTVSPAGK